MKSPLPQWLSRLTSSLERSERICLGLMSGTSANGIDVAICRLTGTVEHGTTGVELLHADVCEYPAALRERIQGGVGALNPQGVAELHAAVGESFADAAQYALKAAKIKAIELDVVGSHGQTVYHHSRRAGVAQGHDERLPAAVAVRHDQFGDDVGRMQRAEVDVERDVEVLTDLEVGHLDGVRSDDAQLLEALAHA